MGEDGRARKRPPTSFARRWKQNIPFAGTAVTPDISLFDFGESVRVEQAPENVPECERRRCASIKLRARSALGFLAVTRADFESAVEQLELVWDKLEAGSVGDPGVLWWQGDLAEAYIALDRRSAAARLHQYIAAQARATVRGWGRGVEARVRGLIEEDERTAAA